MTVAGITYGPPVSVQYGRDIEAEIELSPFWVWKIPKQEDHVKVEVK